MKKRVVCLIFCAAVLGLTACRMPPASSSPPSQSASSEDTSDSQSTSSSSQEEVTQGVQVVLYIGQDGDFTEYPAFYHGQLDESGMIPPQEVIGAMASITGWNLDLAGEVVTGKGGITVSFADTSALFNGPPQNQKEAFFVYDSYQLDRCILDSVKKTLQCWATDPELGNPDGVDVWFCGPDGGDLVLSDLGVTISSTQPYHTFPTPEEEAQLAS